VQRTRDNILSDIAICESKLEELYAMSSRMNRSMIGSCGTFGSFPRERYFGNESCPVFRPKQQSLENDLMILYNELSKLNHSSKERDDVSSANEMRRPSFWRRLFRS
jgi:hypothetical protein